MAKTVAVIGASQDRNKYGNKTARAYRDEGWTVYPVNPKLDEVEGMRCYRSVTDVPDPIDRVAMYVPPRVGKRMIADIAAAKPGEVYFNPGSDDEEIIQMAETLGLNAIRACSILTLGRRPDGYTSEKERGSAGS